VCDVAAALLRLAPDDRRAFIGPLIALIERVVADGEPSAATSPSHRPEVGRRSGPGTRRLMDRLPDRSLARRGYAWALAAWLVAWNTLASSAPAQQPPPDATWEADAALDVVRSITDRGLGAVQGVVVRQGKVYAYGDVVQAEPRVGVIREYDEKLQPTGRVVWLRRAGKPLIVHPTGLTWHDRWGTFLGDTAKTADPARSRAVIYRLDWRRAWEDGDLDRAVRDVIEDDAAVNGCRPEFVMLGGRPLLATADYGEIRPEVRLYDPEALLNAGRSSAPGVVVHRVLCGPFNQNLHWDAEAGHLICVQNVINGRGWRLDELDLARAVADGRAEGPGARVRRLTFGAHDELEGYWRLADRRGLFAVARRRDNLIMGEFRPVEPHPSPPGLGPTPAPGRSGAARESRREGRSGGVARSSGPGMCRIREAGMKLP
jgi:hypothetical protein